MYEHFSLLLFILYGNAHKPKTRDPNTNIIKYYSNNTYRIIFTTITFSLRIVPSSASTVVSRISLVPWLNFVTEKKLLRCCFLTQKPIRIQP